MSSQLMTNSTIGEGDDRLLELLAGETLGDLTPNEQAELDVKAVGLSAFDRSTMDHTAAALALITPQESVPASLSERLLADVGAAPLGGPEAFVEPMQPAGEQSADTTFSFLALTGWIAAAAALAAAFVIAVSAPKPAVNPSIEEQYAAFTGELPSDAVEYEWMNVMQEGVMGKVVWSDTAQEGYMVFEGLAANDPDAMQYQLWIFDDERSAEHPVDGGVFDIADSGTTTIVKIDAKVPVRKVNWFAVTEELPGGVVVSDRSKIPVVANMPS